MAGRFRFTPKCCCGVKEECTPPCIPQCREIFKGFYNYDGHALDTASGDTVEEIYSDRTFIQNQVSNYNEFTSGCLYFDVTIREGAYYAVPSQQYSDGNHLLYSENRRAEIGACAAFNTSDYYNGSVNTPVTFEGVPPIPPMKGYSYSGSVPTSRIAKLSYSQSVKIYNALGVVHWSRTVCLPFDNMTWRVRFCDSAPQYLCETGEVSDIYDFYVSTSGSSYYGCSFTWNNSCNATADTTDQGPKNANELEDFIAGKASNAQNEVISYYDIRLYGFASPTGAYNGFLEDNTAVSMLFRVAFAKKSGTVISVILGDYPVSDCEISHNTFDASTYNKKGSTNTDYPSILLDYSGVGIGNSFALFPYHVPTFISDEVLGGGEWGTEAAYVGPSSQTDTPTSTVVDTRICFGSQNTSALNGTNSIGDSSTAPNRWRSPRIKFRDANNSLSNAFHGVYWMFSQITPCGSSYPVKDVTRGVLWNYPIGRLRVTNRGWSTGYTQGGTQFGVNSITDYQENDASNNIGFVNSLIGKQVIDPSDGNKVYYLDSYDTLVNSEGGTYPFQPYIYRPQGKRLTRLIWRIFLNPATIFYQNYSQRKYANEITCDIVGGLFKEPSGFPAGGNALAKRGTAAAALFSYDVTGVPLVKHVGIQEEMDENAFALGFDRYELCVYGEGASYLPSFGFDIDAYLPTVNDTKFQQILGGTPTNLQCLILLADLGRIRFKEGTELQNADYAFQASLWVYPRYRMSYIAVWEDGNE